VPLAGGWEGELWQGGAGLGARSWAGGRVSGTSGATGPAAEDARAAGGRRPWPVEMFTPRTTHSMGYPPETPLLLCLRWSRSGRQLFVFTKK